MLFWLLLSGLPPAVRGQSVRADLAESGRSERSPRGVIKFAPLTLIDPANTIQFGAEWRAGRGYAGQVEVGYGWQGIGLWETSKRGTYSDRETWRGRAEWRLYLDPDVHRLGIYAAVEGFYKQVNALERSVNAVPCTGPCGPGPTGRSPVRKQVWGGHLKMGYQNPLTANGRLLMDVYSGVGLRYRRSVRPDLPTGVILREEPNLFGSLPAFPIEPTTRFSLSLGVKLGYAF